MKLSELKAFIKEEIKKNLNNEASTTGVITGKGQGGGGSFSTSNNQRKKKNKGLADIVGYDIVKKQ